MSERYTYSIHFPAFKDEKCNPLFQNYYVGLMYDVVTSL